MEMRRVSLEELKWEQYQADFAALASIGENEDGGVDRLAFTEADQQAHGLLAQMAEEAGFEVKWDGAGNLWLLAAVPMTAIQICRHCCWAPTWDTVPDGGKYDGCWA